MFCRRRGCYSNIERIVDKVSFWKDGIYCTNSEPAYDEDGGYIGHFFPTKPADHGLCRYHVKEAASDEEEFSETRFIDPHKAIYEATIAGEMTVCWSSKENLFIIVDEIVATNKWLEPLILCHRPGIPPEVLSKEGEEILLTY